jgi:CheY-like chemotaxis protein
MVYGFVKQSGGHVKIHSEPGQGTTVRIYLPRTREQEDVATDVQTGPARGGSETVLIVEDDEDVRGTVGDMLSELGYRVLKAKDAQSALAVVESGIPVDLLFTDVVMPGTLSSPELARKAKERLPNIAVLFTSGYAQNAIVHGGRLDEGINLLSKPYSREELARKVRHVMRNTQQHDVRQVSSPRLAPGPENGPTPAPRRSRVLLVEDEALIRFNTADMLTSMGHEVAEAANAAEALALLEKSAFDVMVTDIGLPGIPGDDLAVRAIDRQPTLRVVLATGYSSLANSDTEKALSKAVRLRKPYSQQSLCDALNSAVRSPV